MRMAERIEVLITLLSEKRTKACRQLGRHARRGVSRPVWGTCQGVFEAASAREIGPACPRAPLMHVESHWNCKIDLGTRHRGGGRRERLRSAHQIERFLIERDRA